jgi:hypothetical protein|tara:strand:+ start:7103 stop:7909 length:807 start_codon:yes stop_codon:yes gene_type:complete
MVFIDKYFVRGIYIKKESMKSYLYKTVEQAEKAANELGCEGSHKHKRNTFMPCKTHKEFLSTTKSDKPEGEMDEIIDYDGTMLNSKIPILDPTVSADGNTTMDKTVAMARITQDPLTRGYRVYYGESVEPREISEEDMEDAFGYDETKYMDADETIDFFIDELGFDEDDAKGRSEEMGKDPKLDDSSYFKKMKDFVMKGRLVEKGKVLSKEELIKMADDMLVSKSDNKDLKINSKISPILQRNIKVLKKLAVADGISTNELVKILKNE